MREIATEYGESTNSIRIELNRLSKAKILKSERAGRTIEYQANAEHPLFMDIRNIVNKYVGFDKLVEQLFQELGGVQSAYITGDYAKGLDSGLIDLVLVGEIDKTVVERLTQKTEKLIKRKIRSLILTPQEHAALKKRLLKDKILLLWSSNQETTKAPPRAGLSGS